LVEKIPEEILREMHNDMVDCANIASSAMTLAAERSQELQIPVQITLITLKVLIEINIKKSMDERTLPEPARELCSAIGLDEGKASVIAHEELERLIRAWMAQAKYREATVG